MVDKSIIKYIKSSLARGLSKDQIKKNLKANGWTDADINEAVAVAGTAQPATTKPGKSVVATTNQPAKTIVKSSPESALSKNIWIFLGLFVLVVVIVVIVFFVFRGDKEETCFDLGGYVCGTGEECDGTYLDASDTYDCCSIACVESCAESWECGNWTACVNDAQERNCTDLNDCGTTINKPVESRYCGGNESCINDSICELGCENQGGDIDCSCEEQNNASSLNITLCGVSEECNGTIIDSNESGQICCIGGCFIPPNCNSDGHCVLGCVSGDSDCSCEEQDGTLCNSTTVGDACSTGTRAIGSSDYVSGEMYCCPSDCRGATPSDPDIT